MNRRPLFFASVAIRLLCSVDASSTHAACPPACGLAYTVTSTGDGDLVGPSTQCDDGTGHCTLRAAITAANLHSGDDGILFDIPLTDPGYNADYGGWFINLTKALPDIASNVSINGPGATKLAVQGIQNTPGIRIFNVTATGTVSFSGIRIGQTTLDTAGLHGAGIQNVNAGTINITDCFFDNIFAFSGGAGVYNNTGVVNITGTTFRVNNTEGTGGAILNGSGTMNIRNCLFQGCNAQGPMGTGASGSAISNGTGKVNVTSSTIDSNFANSGAIASLTSGGVISLANCTLSRNEAQGGGGAITVKDGTVNLTNCTLSGNSISNGANGGAGAILVTAPGTVNVKSTLIAKNTATGFNVRAELSGTFVSQGYNLVGDPAGGDGFNAPTDHVGTFSTPLDAKLDPDGLQDNGGPTETIALLFGSPAIDQGMAGVDPITGLALTTDQRGGKSARKFDDPNISNASGGDGTDIGAFEMQTSPTTLANVSTRLPVQTGDNALFAGFIITGSHPKKVAIIGLGPSLSHYFTGVLADPVLELYNSSGHIESNDNWMDSPDKQAIMDNGVAPSDSHESAILLTLPANGATYTAILRGVNNGTGIGLVEAFDLDRDVESKLANISTRGLVQTGDNLLIAGTIIVGQAPQRVLICALGPSLPLAGKLADPFLELHDGNGAIMQVNDNWVDSTDKQAIMDTGAAPPNDLEPAIISTLPSNGAIYTAIVRGTNNGTGIAVVEVFALD